MEKLKIFELLKRLCLELFDTRDTLPNRDVTMLHLGNDVIFVWQNETWNHPATTFLPQKINSG